MPRASVRNLKSVFPLPFALRSVRSRMLSISLLMMICTCIAYAAVSLSTSSPAVQNFDGIGTAAAAVLPADFKVDKQATVRMVGNYGTALSATSAVGGANLSTTAGNGIYNFGSGTTTTGTDRAVGFLSSGSATQSGNLYAQYVNTTGASLSGLQIAYNVEKYRNGINPAGFCIQLYFSSNGTNWTSAGSDFLTTFAGDTGTNTGFASVPAATLPINKPLSITIPDGSSLYLAWNYSVCTGTITTNAQALAIDDISVLGIPPVNTPTNPAGTGNANPNPVQAGNSTRLTVNVTPGANPPSKGLAVTVDLSSIGGSQFQQFFDNGTNGDVTSGDNIYSFQTVVPAGTTAGSKTLLVKLSDLFPRTGSASITLVVTPNSTPPTGVGSATPASLQEGSTTLLKVSVSPGANPTSAGVTVSGDLSSIGGSSSQQFFDDGSQGDTTANDNVFSFQIAIASGTSPGQKSIPVTIRDAQGRSSNGTVLLTVQPPPPPTTVKISQVYGGGGNSGSTYKNDFIEIFNQALTPIDLAGWSVQYNSATNTTGPAGIWQVTPLCVQSPCILLPGHYFLVQESQGTGGTTLLPTPDAVGNILVSGSNAKVALVANTIALSGTCPTGGPLVDQVGYGSANCFETAATPSLSNTTAAVRKGNGCVDTDNNLNDFAIVGPIPRNSASPGNSCGGNPGQPSGLGIATPGSLDPASNTLLTVKVTAATTPPSTGLAVVADLSSIGGPATQAIYDDATHGDQTAGDGVFSFQATVGAFIPTGAKSIVATISDAQGRTATAPITLTVASPTCGVERWSVKTGGDPDAQFVNINNLIPGKIADLGALNAPATPPDNARFGQAEFTEYVVNATMTFFKKEGDVDYHIVLQDDSLPAHTLIAEIPSPACVSPASPFATAIATARAKFDSRFTATEFFSQVLVPVQVKGIGFFDFIHGQTGVAPNGIELHPLLEINFTANTTTTLTSSANPTQFKQAVAITGTVSNGGTTVPTGALSFFDGATPIGKVILKLNGQATLNPSNLIAGTHSITASYEGDSTSAPSTSTAFLQLVNKADQSINFGALGGKIFGAADFNVNASASSELEVSFSIVSGPATISGSSVHITGAGTVTVRASQAGDDNYNAALDVDQSFEVAKADQKITFAALEDKTYGGAPFSVSATGGASNISIAFSATGDCTSSGSDGSTITIIGGGSCTVTASQIGDSNYNPAKDVSRTFAIKPAAATVTVNGYSGVYDGHAHGASGTAKGVNGEDLSSLLNLGAVFTDSPGGVAHWSFAGDSNYAPSSGDVSIAISKASASINVNGYSGVYDGHAHGVTGTAKGVAGKDLSGLLNLGGTFADVPGGIAHWVFAGNTNYEPASGDSNIAIAKATPTFSNLTSPVISFGTASTTLSGKLSLSALIPTGIISITLNGVSQSALIQPDGSFWSSFGTGSLPPANPPYNVAFSYAGDRNFNPIAGAGTLTVSYGVAPLYDISKANKSGSTIPIKLMLTNSEGANLSSASIPVAAVRLVQVSSSSSSDVEDSGNANPDNNFRFAGGQYIFNLSTKGLASGSWQLIFTVAGDSVPHALPFQIR